MPSKVDRDAIVALSEARIGLSDLGEGSTLWTRADTPEKDRSLGIAGSQYRAVDISQILKLDNERSVDLFRSRSVAEHLFVGIAKTRIEK
eukprot:scaffold327_cov257-Pinguiococcus_pyrenoidosus.AAC.27